MTDNSKIERLSTSRIFVRTATACLVAMGITGGALSYAIGTAATKQIEQIIDNNEAITLASQTTSYGFAKATTKTEIIIDVRKIFGSSDTAQLTIPAYTTVIATTEFSPTQASTKLKVLGDSSKLMSDFINRNEIKFTDGVKSNYERNEADGSLELPVLIQTNYDILSWLNSNGKIDFDTRIALKNAISPNGTTIKDLAVELGHQFRDHNYQNLTLSQLKIAAPKNKNKFLINIENLDVGYIANDNAFKASAKPDDSLIALHIKSDYVGINGETRQKTIQPLITVKKFDSSFNAGNNLDVARSIDQKAKKSPPDEYKNDLKISGYPFDAQATISADSVDVVGIKGEHILADARITGISPVTVKEAYDLYKKAENGDMASQAALTQTGAKLIKEGMNIDRISIQATGDYGKISNALTMKFNPVMVGGIESNPFAAITALDLQFTSKMPYHFVTKSLQIPEQQVQAFIDAGFVLVEDDGKNLSSDIKVKHNSLLINGQEKPL